MADARVAEDQHGQHGAHFASPSPGGWPLVGSLPEILVGGMDWVLSREDELGDIYAIDIGPQTVVLVSHPDHAQYVLRTRESNFAKQGTFWSSVRSLIGQGLPTSEGELWRSRRRMMNPHFRRERLQVLSERMAAVVQEQVGAWPTDGAVVSVGDLVNQATMAVIVRTMFGTGMTPAQSAEVSEAMAFTLDHMLQKVLTDALPA